MQQIGELLVLSPSDLVAFTACEHRTALDLQAARHGLPRMVRDDAFADLIRRHGEMHETRYLEELRREVGTVVEIARPAPGLEGLREAELSTLAAMSEGVDLIYQASFFDGRWRGHADFLRRMPMSSRLGSWSYEAYDTKLARSVRAGTVLQLAEYSRQVARLQGCEPLAMHVVGGDGHVETFRYAEASAYLATVRERFETAVDAGLRHTQPEPVDACGFCNWFDRCSAEWRQEDHLSLVAGARRAQRERLVAAGITTRRQLAGTPAAAAVPQLTDSAFSALRSQAMLQVRSEAEGTLAWQLIPVDPEGPHVGLAVLPAPNPGDIFFDMEGDRFIGDGGREYLFGWVDGDAPAAPFRCLWAHDPQQERAAFEAFIDTVMARRREHPAMHVYHYAAYEQTAMKLLMGRHSTRETEVDELLRGGVFVDLYRIVRQSVRIGTQSYSIKKLEPLYTLVRSGDVVDAGMSIVQYELWMTEQRQDLLDAIGRYNEDDCRSLVGLRGWLEDRRHDLELLQGETLPRPPLVPGEASELVSAAGAEVAEVVAGLMADIPAVVEQRNHEQGARALLASLLDWHRRDDKPKWWEHFARRNATDDDLVDDVGTIGGLTLQDSDGFDKRSRLHRFSFPPQETRMRVRETVYDPRTVDDGAGGWTVETVGVIHELDAGAGHLVIKRQKPLVRVPTGLIPGRPIPTAEQRARLLELGRWVTVNGLHGEGPWRAARDLLLRGPPRIAGVHPGAALAGTAEDASRAARRCLLAAEQTCLPVQGPPGSGKTHTGVQAIIDLVRARPRRRVGVTALSHRAISHLLTVLCEEADRQGVGLVVYQKSDDEAACTAPAVVCVGSNEEIDEALSDDAVDVVAGTSWLFARSSMRDRFDTLFVDEAGQLSLANVLAMSGCAANLVLLGDPQQLEQPSNGTHPEGAGASAFGHLVAGHETVPPQTGIFLDKTWRMHPDVCGYISDIFYESRLHAAAGAEQLHLDGVDALAGTGLRWFPVEHTGNQTTSTEEVDAVEDIVRRLLGRLWVDRHGVTRALRAADILVVAPYNAHVAALRERLPAAVPVGTVDSFQGQEGAVVIYSMATSMAEDVPRGMEFLYSPNRLNVAVSRARCVAVLVCSPALVQARCSTAGQIRSVNALCAFVQRAVVVESPTTTTTASVAAMAGERVEG